MKSAPGRGLTWKVQKCRGYRKRRQRPLGLRVLGLAWGLGIGSDSRFRRSGLNLCGTVLENSSQWQSHKFQVQGPCRVGSEWMFGSFNQGPEISSCRIKNPTGPGLRQRLREAFQGGVQAPEPARGQVG